MSALADRIKIARNGSVGSHDIDLSVQHILNCGGEIAGRYVRHETIIRCVCRCFSVRFGCLTVEMTRRPLSINYILLIVS